MRSPLLDTLAPSARGVGSELGPLHPAPLTTSLERLRHLVSPFTGLVREVDEVVKGPGESRFVLFGARAGAEISGVGTGPRRDAALVSAIAESIERYAMSYADPRVVRVASFRELSEAALDPARFALFHPTQHDAPSFPFARFTRDTRVPWVRGVRVLDNAPTWVPLDAAVRPASLDLPTEWIAAPSSNGLACHLTWEEAVLAGLLEVLERDAFTLAWYSRLSLPVISEDLGELEKAASAALLPRGATLRAVDLSAFHGMPTVMVIVRAPAPDPVPLTIGAATRLTLGSAYEKAACEACHIRAVVGLDGLPPIHDADSVEEPLHHAQFYLEREHLWKTDFLDAGREVPASPEHDIRTDDVRRALREVIARVRRGGSDVYAVDVTPPDVRAAGLVVVKTVCPELQPLDIPHRARHLGSPRLRTLPAQLGLRDEPVAFEDLNHDPHPFA